MAVTYQDYYQTLGVDKSASQAEVQRAYRKLARKFHPDINTSGDAEEKFKQINEAYEVLGDPDKRKKYDQVGSSWNEDFDFHGGHGADEMHFSFRSDDPGQFSDFFQNLFGGGWGYRRSGDMEEGVRRRRGEDHQATIEITLQDAFQGSKKTVELERIDFDPGGIPARLRKRYDITIPRGVTDGSLIRLAGQGGAGSGGGPEGDLYLKVRILPDPQFGVRDHDLITSVDITPWEAALGAKIQLATIDGRINLAVPPGTQSGQTLRLRGKGMPINEGTSGDLLVNVRIVVPPHLSASEKHLFEELSRESRFTPRQSHW
jgi:curved DNA-binding protein